MSNYIILFISLSVFLHSCGPRSLEDCRDQAERVSRNLLYDLEKIETKDDLTRAIPKLRGHYTQLADLLIDAHSLKEGEITVYSPSHSLNEDLRKELVRVYSIDGGRELMEKAQREGLHRLNLYAPEMK
ncbi:MAG: hypothetical protein CMO81_08340 [Waddliaceae bacterium]|nr:hypothetical protein [Waddliaceae bacterium]